MFLLTRSYSPRMVDEDTLILFLAAQKLMTVRDQNMGEKTGFVQQWIIWYVGWMTTVRGAIPFLVKFDFLVIASPFLCPSATGFVFFFLASAFTSLKHLSRQKEAFGIKLPTSLTCRADISKDFIPWLSDSELICHFH